MKGPSLVLQGPSICPWRTVNFGVFAESLSGAVWVGCDGSIWLQIALCSVSMHRCNYADELKMFLFLFPVPPRSPRRRTDSRSERNDKDRRGGGSSRQQGDRARRQDDAARRRGDETSRRRASDDSSGAKDRARCALHFLFSRCSVQS